MFNESVLQRLKKAHREDKFNSYGEHAPMRTLLGGIRYGAHPTPEMDFQPDNLYTGEEMYEDIKPKRVGRTRGGRLIGGMDGKVHHGYLSKELEGGSLKSFGRSLSRGFKKLNKDLAPVGKALAPVGKFIGKEVVAPVVKDFATKEGRKFLAKQLEKFAVQDVLPVAEEAAPLMLAAGRRRKSNCSGCSGCEGGKRKPSLGSDKRSARAALVRQIMKQHGMSLPEASRYIKENGISY
jgi:hypothetical protein